MLACRRGALLGSPSFSCPSEAVGRSPYSQLRRTRAQLPGPHSSFARARRREMMHLQKAPTGPVQKLKSFAKRRPFLFQLYLNSVLCTIADGVIQYREEDEEYNPKRSLTFCGFGAVSSSITWWWYMTVYGRLFPAAKAFSNLPLREKLRDPRGCRDVVLQTLADLWFYGPLWYFPFYYMFKNAIQSDSSDPAVIVNQALTSYSKTWFYDNLSNFAVWFPCNIIVFTVPVWLRMPTNQCINFLWTMGLSYARGGSESKACTEAEGPDFSQLASKAVQTAKSIGDSVISTSRQLTTAVSEAYDVATQRFVRDLGAAMEAATEASGKKQA